jgi:UDP-3-O-[3-hydroxymyristoyl] glucosamine N-acyltransferase
LSNSLYKKYLSTTQASAVILTQEDAATCSVNKVITPYPYYVYAKIAEFFIKPVLFPSGIHATAIVGDGCHIDPSAYIGPYCVIGKQVNIGAHAVVGPNCQIGDLVNIGEFACLDGRVTIYHRVKIGKQSRLASGVVVGGDGFGFAPYQGTFYKVPQLGSVTIGNYVDIGANTTIDRGAVDDTIIEDGVKLDNLIQIGHNVRIGANTVIAGCTGVAGTAVIGKNCMIGGACSINGHLTIVDNVILTGTSSVSKSILKPGVYSSGLFNLDENRRWRKAHARINRIEELAQRIKDLEFCLKNLVER